MKTMKGPAIFLAQFAGDAAPFNSLDTIAKWAASARLQGRPDPDLGRPAVRSRQGGASEDLLRRDQGHLPRRRRRDHRALDASAGPARRGPSGLRHAVRRLRAPQVRGNPKARQEWAVEADAEWPRRPRATRPEASVRSPARSPGPILYPWPQRPPGLIETAFDELASAGSRSSTPTTRPASTSATRSIRARTLSTARPSRCSSSGVEQPPALRHPLRPDPLRAAAARLSRLHRHLPRADQDVPRQGRGVQSDRPAGRLFRLSSAGSTAPGASARSATGRSTSPASSPSSPQYDYDGWAVLEWECASSIPRTARAKARRSSQRHIIRVTEQRLRRLRRRRHGRDGEPQAARHQLSSSRRGRCTENERRRRIRLGMVGGGEGAFIGAVHRIAARHRRPV